MSCRRRRCHVPICHVPNRIGCRWNEGILAVVVLLLQCQASLLLVLAPAELSRLAAVAAAAAAVVHRRSAGLADGTIHRIDVALAVAVV